MDTNSALASLTVCAVGPHSRTWTTSTNVADQGHKVVEVATGMNYWDGQQWQPSNPSFQSSSNGFAATTTQQKAYLAEDINVMAAVTVTTPDGTNLYSSPLAIALYDAASGNLAIIGTITNSQAVMLNSNRITYPDAFAGICADVVYTMERGAFHQDVVLSGNFNVGAYGFPTNTTRIQVITEFYNPPDPNRVLRPLYVEQNPEVRNQMATPDLVDQTLGFGQSTFGPGRAYLVATTNATDRGLAVAKQWLNVNGRIMLVETIPYTSAKSKLDQLPPCSASQGQGGQGAAIQVGNGKSVYASIPVPPKAGTATAAAKPGQPKTNRAESTRPGFVIDYVEIYGDMGGDYTFQSDTTYLVSDAFYCEGALTIEGGAVMKHVLVYDAFSSAAKIQVDGTLSLTTAPYRPAVFTAVDDNTVGQRMSTGIWWDYTGNPTPNAGLYGTPFLYFSSYSGVLRNLGFRYAEQAVYLDGSSSCTLTLTDGQLLHCGQGIEVGYGSGANSTVTFNNCLFYDVNYTVTDDGDGSSLNAYQFVNCTFDTIPQLANVPSGTPLTYTNCIFGNITSGVTGLAGGYNGFYSATHFGSPYYSSGVSPFSVVGAGGHYQDLANTNGVFELDGTTNIDSALLTSLRGKTVHQPTAFAGGYDTNYLTLNPLVHRDNGTTLALGYHYDPIDYAFGGVTLSNAPLTIMPGTVVAFFATNGSSYGLQVGSDALLAVQGSPTAITRIIGYDTVQEQYSTNWSPPTNGLITVNSTTSPYAAVLDFRFTDFSVLAQETAYLYGPTNTVGPLNLQNCQLHGGTINCSNATVDLANCLLERVATTMLCEDGLTPYVFNNTFWYGTFTVRPSNTNAVIQNNLFDHTTNSDFGFTNYYGRFNGYVTNCSQLSLHDTNDVILTTAAYESGPGGTYYLPTNSLLINKGSTTADVLGLATYTTRVDQTPEGNSRVDIGLHYWVDQSAPYIIGQPIGQAVWPGDSATFSVAVVSNLNPTLYYHWFFNGVAVAGGTSPTLTITNIGNGQIGNYWLTVSNASGSNAVSAIATLEILDGCTKSYSSSPDFLRGYRVNLNNTTFSNQLQLNQHTSPFEFVNAASSEWGTLIRVDANSGAVVGEYYTAPNYSDGTIANEDGHRHPQATAVDRYGNAWVGNALEGTSGGVGSVTRVGLIVGGTRVQKVVDPAGNTLFVASTNGAYLAPPFVYNTCVDRDRDGLIQTSFGLSNILSWSNTSGTNTSVDTLGTHLSGTNLLSGVQTAQDEALLNYVRMIGSQARSLAVDRSNNLWVACEDGTRTLTRIDGVTGLTNYSTNVSAGGFSGLVDPLGFLWSTGEAAPGASNFLVMDTTGTNPLYLPPHTNASPAYPYGDYCVGVDPVLGDVWITSFANNHVARYNYVSNSLNFIGEYDHGSADGFGVAVDSFGNVWTSQGKNSTTNLLGHLVISGTSAIFVGSVPLTNSTVTTSDLAGPTAVSIDHKGKIWVARDYFANGGLTRVDPSVGPTITTNGITVSLGATDFISDFGKRVVGTSTNGPSLDGCSDMTGFVTLGSTIPSGMWDFVHNGGQDSMQWGSLTWTTGSTNDQVSVEVRGANRVTDLPAANFTAVSNGVAFSSVYGHYLEIRVVLSRPFGSTNLPTLTDLTVCCSTNCGQSPTVAIITPSYGATLGTAPTNVILHATATAYGGKTVKYVEFFEGTNLLGITGAVGTNGDYQISWNPVMGGSHTIKAQVGDSAGLIGDSTNVIFTMRNPPIVSITSPANGSVFYPGPTNLTVTASVTPDTGLTISSVQFYSGTTNIASRTTSPWSITTNFGVGTYNLTAKATDSLGASKVSRTVTFTVDPTNRPPIVDPGPNQTNQLPNAVFLAGSVWDDGLPLGSNILILWTNISGPGTVTFANSNSASTTATFSANGTYTLGLSAYDGQFTVSSNVTITVLASLSVTAYSNQTVVLPATPPTNFLDLKPGIVTVFYDGTNSYSPIGVDYFAPSNALVVSRAGTPFFLVRPDGSFTSFGTDLGWGDELNIGSVRDTLGGFNVGEFFTGVGENNKIGRVEPNGSTLGNILGGLWGYSNVWMVLTNEPVKLMRGNFHVDRTGVFGGDLIAASGDGRTGGGNVWRINSGGSSNLLATFSTAAPEGLTTVPNDPQKYGPWAGKILVGDDLSASIYSIDTNGFVVSYDFTGLFGDHTDVGDTFNVEDIAIIPAQENFYAADHDGQVLWGIPASQFCGMAGDILVTSETSGRLFRIHWDGTKFNVFWLSQIPASDSVEQSAFAPCGVSNVVDTAFAQLSGLVLENGSSTTNASNMWRTVSGPDTVGFDMPTSLATRARFSTPGTYLLRLSAADGQLSGHDQVTIQVLRNQPPVVDAGTNQIVATSKVNLYGTVTDDGWPSNHLTVTWSQYDGPGTATFYWSNSVTSTNLSFNATNSVSVDTAGSYTFHLSASDGDATVVSEVRVTFAAPQLTLSPNYSGPFRTNVVAPITATLINSNGIAISGSNVVLTVSNYVGSPQIFYLTNSTDTNGLARFFVTNTIMGRCWIQGSYLDTNGLTDYSQVVSVDWAGKIDCGSTSNYNSSSFSDMGSPNEVRPADYYFYYGLAGTPVAVDVKASSGGHLPILFVKDSTNNLLAAAPGAISPNDLPYVFTLPYTGDYIFEVTTVTANGPGTSAGTISVLCSNSIPGPQIGVLLGGTNLPSGSTLTFNTTTGVTNSIMLTVTNFGSDALLIPSVVTNGDFWANLSSTNIAPQTNADLKVVFKATSNGTWSGALSLSNNSAAQQYVLSLVGTATPGGTSPTVQLTSPVTGSSFLAPANILLTASATAGSTNVTNVAFAIKTPTGYGLIANCATNPYSTTWSNVAAGDYTLAAIATDANGRTKISSPVVVHVLSPTQYGLPVANNDSFTIPLNSQNNYLNVLANDTDTNFASLRIVSVSNVRTGIVSIINNGRGLAYTPPTNTIVNDWFSYTIINGNGLTATAYVSVKTPYPYPPTITLTAPTNGQSFVAGSLVTSSATVTTSNATVAVVQFYLDDRLVQTYTNASSTYTNDWIALAGAPHSIYAVVTDSLGQMAQSTTANITITTIHTNDLPPIAIIGNVTNFVNANASTPIIQDGIFALRGQATGAPGTNANDAIQYQLNLYNPDWSFVANLNHGGFLAGPITNGGLLTNLDFTMIQNGVYILELVVDDTTVHTETRTNVTFTLDSGLKIGQFSFSQQDLVIPAGGMPLSVVRTYNSINPNLGDFGYGWTYAINDLQVQLDESRTETNDADATDNSTFSMRIGGGRDVTLTLPDGRRTTFSFYLDEHSDCGWPGLCYTGSWAPAPGINATLTAQDDTTMETITGVGGQPYWRINYGLPVDELDFSGFILTTADGTQYYINRQDLGWHDLPDDSGVHAFGQPYLSKIVSPNHNTITITPNGIISKDSSNNIVREVVFQRQNGLIVAITDPNGLNSDFTTNGSPPAVIYQYDNNQNLLNVLKLTDRSGSGTYVTNTFNYTNAVFPHYVTSIKDASGTTPLRTLYNDAGQMIGTIDAFGHTNSFAAGTNANTQVVYDRAGNHTTYSYDLHGNVTDIVDALGKHSHMDYDTNNRVITSMDALSNTTHFVYDNLGNQTQVTDARTNTTYFTYDSASRLLSRTDPLTNTTWNLYDADGNLTNTATYDFQSHLVQQSFSTFSNELLYQTLDTSNRVTGTFLYDTAGNLTNSTDANGFSRSFGYDASGNQISTLYVGTTLSGSPTNITTSTIYDGSGRIVQRIDENGNTNQTIYTVTGAVDHTIDKIGNTNSFVYDAMGNVIQRTYPDGLMTFSVYDANGRAYFTTDRNQVTGTLTSFDAVGRVTNSVRYSNVVVSVIADINNPAQWTSVISSNGAPFSTNATTYLDNGWVYSRTTPDGQTTTYDYWPDGQVKTVTDPLTHTTSYTYDAAGRRQTMTDALTHTSTFQYDAVGRLIATIYPNASYTSNYFDLVGQNTGRVDQAGLLTQFNYSAAGQLIGVTKPQVPDPEISNALTNPIWSYTYDTYGHLCATTDPKGRTNGIIYDPLGRQVSQRLPIGQTNFVVYNNLGQVVTNRDFKSQQVTNAYDHLGRLKTKFYFDASNNLANVVCYEYDTLGRLSQITELSGSDVTNASNYYAAYFQPGNENRFASAGLLSKIGRIAMNLALPLLSLAVLGLGFVLVPRLVWRMLREYYLRGGVFADGQRAAPELQSRLSLRLPAIGWRAVSIVMIVVLCLTDQKFNLFLSPARAQCDIPSNSSTDTTRITKFAYDFDGHVTQVNSPEGVINYAYDMATGRRIHTCTTNSELAYEYDQLGRLYTVTVLKRNGSPVTNEVTTYNYDNVGNRHTVSLPNGVVTTYTYDNLNRLTNLTHAVGTTNLATYSYILDSTGRRTNAVELLLQEAGAGYLTNTLAWGYDAMHRLTNEVSSSSGSGGTFSTAYQYDRVGNRLKQIRVVGSTTTTVDSTFDSNDELLTELSKLNGSVTDTNTYGYDANGSVTGKANGSGTITYTYDLKNKLSAVTSGTNTTSYLYDDQGIRVQAGTVHYLIDANNHTGYQQVLEELSTVGGTPSRSYVIGDDVLAQSGSSTPSYFLADGHSSTRQLTSMTAVVSSRYNYDAYGQTLTSSTGSPETTKLYCGEQIDTTLNMYNLRARYYDPSNGRFSARDTFAGITSDPVSLHKYAYAGLDPVNAIDPSGMFFGGLIEFIQVAALAAWGMATEIAKVLVPGLKLLATLKNLLVIINGIQEGLQNLLYGPEQIPGLGRFAIGLIAGIVQGYLQFYAASPALGAGLGTFIENFLNAYFVDSHFGWKVMVDILVASLFSFAVAKGIASAIDKENMTDALLFFIGLDATLWTKALANFGEFWNLNHFTDLLEKALPKHH